MNTPTGTITFLFTDIEGSTKLWENAPEAMRLALARHDALLREAIGSNQGYVFKTVGDAFCAAFPTALDAVQAALNAHLLLIQEEWGEIGAIRVRMAMHTGSAEERDNDYFGPTLNRAARLEALAHGGQTLLSQATYELVRDRLPELATLHNLGPHSLKDLNRPEQVYQLSAPGMLDDFPPLRSLNNFPNNLPIQPTSFIGREKEMQEIKKLLRLHPLVTLLAPGGTGKSRLSLQVGADLFEEFPDGVWFIELAALTDPAMVVPAAACVIGVREEAGHPLLQTLREALASRKMLLILDNCEHLIAECARFAQSLIQSCPFVRLLASSRESLNVPGETAYRIPSLQVPDPKSRPTLETLTQFDAVRLFIDRATSIQNTFALTRENVPSLAQLCARLDGIPLAIELAAARIRSLSIEEINSRLDNCFRLLTGGSRTALPRQQTLRALIDWSFDMLNPVEKQLFCRLSIFSGGWMLEAAEAVCVGEEVEDWEVLDLLTGLADKSLVVAEPQEAQTRYRLLGTIRQYAHEKLQESGENERLAAVHHRSFFTFVEETSAGLLGNGEQAALELLNREQENLRTALDWAMAHDPNAALRMAVRMGRFWYLGGYLREGRERLESVLATGAAAESGLHAEALFEAGRLAVEQGDLAPARPLLERCRTLCRETGKSRLEAAAMNSLGIIALLQSDYPAARDLLKESIALQREQGNREGMVAAMINLANLLQDQGEYAEARLLYEESILIEQALGKKRGLATALLNLGNMLHLEGEVASARTRIEQSLAIGRELKDDWFIAYALGSLANIAYYEGEYSQARPLAEECLEIVHSIGDALEVENMRILLGGIAAKEGKYAEAASFLTKSMTLQIEKAQTGGNIGALEAFAGLAAAQMDNASDTEQAKRLGRRVAQLFAYVEVQRTALGTPASPPVQKSRESHLAAVQAVLREAAFTAAWAEGTELNRAEAIALALSEA